MVEQASLRLPERLGLEQNIFDQPAFTGIRVLGDQYGSQPYINAVTYTTAGAFIKSALGYVSPVTISVPSFLDDESRLQSATHFIFQTLTIHPQIRIRLKGLPVYDQSPDKNAFIYVLLDSIRASLDDPILQMLYLAEHKNLYKANGIPILSKKSPEETPLIYEPWKEESMR